MSVVPKPLVERVQFFQTRLDRLEANAAHIGVPPAELALLRDRTEAARQAYHRQQAALLAARSATLAFNLAVADMSRIGSAVILFVRGKAQTTGDDDVYALASLPRPATRGPIGPPGRPTRLSVALDDRGALTLRWSCRTPRGSKGTMYHVARRTGPHGPFAYLGIVGAKRFVDATVPAGTAALTYRVRACRSTREGECAEFFVRFGSTVAARAA